MHKLISIKIQGKCFHEYSDLNLFPQDTRYSIIYGENGSGKSTIAKAMFNAKKNNINLKVFNKDGEFDFNSHIYVFNEQFVDENIRFKENGLSTIIRLGDDAKILKVEEKRSNLITLLSDNQKYLDHIKRSLRRLNINIENYMVMNKSELENRLIQEEFYFLDLLNEEEKNLENLELYKKKLGGTTKEIDFKEKKIFKSINHIEAELGKHDRLRKYFDDIQDIEEINYFAHIGIEDCEHELEYLNEIENTVPVNEINKYLKLIFCEENRLKIELENNKNPTYLVKCNGSNVEINDLSVGERNIISICYFISLINQKLPDDVDFKKNCLVIFDDPISSLDQNNKIGIYYLMKYVLTKIHKNSESKVIILTHKLEVVSHFDKIFDSINNSYKHSNNSKIGKVNYKCLELKNEKILDLNVDKLNVYTNLLNLTYEYAMNNGNTNAGLTIGNVIRRVLESYSTFLYKCPVEELVTNSLILSKLDLKQIEYFENSMFRLVLHGESHTRDIAKSEQDYFDGTNPKEKQRIARDALMLLFLLDDVHIRIHFNRDEKKIRNIEKWLKEIQY